MTWGPFARPQRVYPSDEELDAAARADITARLGAVEPTRTLLVDGVPRQARDILATLATAKGLDLCRLETAAADLPKPVPAPAVKPAARSSEAAPAPKLRRFPIVVSSETPVWRRDYGGLYQEILSHAPGAVDLSRAPLPVLIGHDTSQLNIGVVDNLRLAGGQLVGDLVLGTSKRAQEIAADIDAQILTGSSVGYLITDPQRSADGSKLTARKWAPHEVSLVSVPADLTAGLGRRNVMINTTAPIGTTSTRSAAPVAQPDGDPTPPVNAPSELEQLRREIAALRDEVARLRADRGEHRAPVGVGPLLTRVIG